MYDHKLKNKKLFHNVVKVTCFFPIFNLESDCLKEELHQCLSYLTETLDQLNLSDFEDQHQDWQINNIRFKAFHSQHKRDGEKPICAFFEE